MWCPDLPGCWSQGATAAEALENIGDAIRAYHETARDLDSITAGLRAEAKRQGFTREELETIIHDRRKQRRLSGS